MLSKPGNSSKSTSILFSLEPSAIVLKNTRISEVNLRYAANSTVISTSTRNFPNRLGDGANVFLASAELSAISSVLGKLPTVEEYHQYMNDINPLADQIYRYLNFNEIDTYVQSANSAEIPAINIVNP